MPWDRMKLQGDGECTAQREGISARLLYSKFPEVHVRLYLFTASRSQYFPFPILPCSFNGTFWDTSELVNPTR